MLDIIFLVGIKTTQKIKLRTLSSKLTGFLEYIPRTHFKRLQRLHYKSLYSFDYEDPEDVSRGNRIVTKTYYFILFGPLALCNASEDVSVRFWNFDLEGNLLIWQLMLKMFEEFTESNEQTVTAYTSTDALSIVDAKFTPDGDRYAPFGIEAMHDLKHIFIAPGGNTKVELFVKVILHHRSMRTFNLFEYEADEEVFVKYNLTDMLIL